jgi:16S rRNA (adenine1518-N6/adenine1519-N6)-dimethyltransferase
VVKQKDSFPKKSLGQHWLSDETVLESIVAFADTAPTDTVLEIGPGPGTLTELLLNKVQKVIAVELDPALAEGLSKRLDHEPNLAVHCEDIRRFDLTALPKDYKVVANIPYYLTSYLIRMLSTTNNPPVTAVLLIQQEVAERLAARPGSLSLLGVTAQSYWDVELGRIVPADIFFPPPKVNSRVVKLSRKNDPILPDAMKKEFLQTIRIGFSQKRKTLVNALSAGFHLTKTETKTIIETAGLNVTIRPQELSTKDWLNLTKALKRLNK